MWNRGLGWLGSIAIGVSTGNTAWRKYLSSDRDPSLRDRFAVDADAGRGERRHDRLVPARVLLGHELLGPLGDALQLRERLEPVGGRILRQHVAERLLAQPATRTMKNSSRFEAKIARNLTRSKSGLESSCASSSTRALNSSQLNSRLMKCSGRKVEGSESMLNFTTFAELDRRKPEASPGQGTAARGGWNSDFAGQRGDSAQVSTGR